MWPVDEGCDFLMAYFDTQPGINDLSKVRLIIADNDESDELLTDGEIFYLLEEEGTVTRAAIAAAEIIAAKFARLPDKTIGRMSESNANRAKQYEAIAKRLRDKDAEVIAAYLGGSEMVPEDMAVFEKGMMEQPNGTSESNC